MINFKTSKINIRLILIFLFLASAFALSLAYISQYIFGLQPCALCLYQRIPYFLIIFITLFTIFVIKSEKWQRTLLQIALIILIFNIFLALYHFGVEKGIFIFDKCANLISNSENLEILQQQISQAKAVRCDQPQFILFGISMAGWNVLYCAFVAFLIIFTLKKTKNPKL